MDETLREYFRAIGQRGVAARARADRRCEQCGLLMLSTTRKRRYCSHRCNVRALRASQRARASEAAP